MQQTSEAIARLEALEPELMNQAALDLSEGVVSIGRAAGCDLVVRHALVSRMHALVERHGLRYTIVDTDSANGTYVNGVRLSAPRLLSHDDRIGLGAPDALLRFIDPDPTLIRPNLLRYDEQTMLFTLGAQPLALPPTQFRLLLHLYRHAGDICSRESCAQAIWERPYDHSIDANLLDQAVTGLRRALRAIDPNNEALETRRSLGYVLMV
jgi:DNA-binding response OmpR family regulator